MAVKRATPRINMMDAISDRAQLVSRNRTAVVRMGHIGEITPTPEGYYNISIGGGIGNVEAVSLIGNLSRYEELVVLCDTDAWWIIGQPHKRLDAVTLTNHVVSPTVAHDTVTAIELSVSGNPPYTNYVCPHTGDYLVSGGVQWNAPPSAVASYRSAFVTQNGSELRLTTARTLVNSGTGAPSSLDVSTTLRPIVHKFNKNDVIGISVRQNSTYVLRVQEWPSLTIVPL